MATKEICKGNNNNYYIWITTRAEIWDIEDWTRLCPIQSTVPSRSLFSSTV